jgi:hypothetical protein
MPAGYFMPVEWAPGASAVRWVLFLELHAGEPPRLTRLAPADSAAAILSHSLNLPQAARVGLTAAARLTSTATCLHFVNGRLAESVALVEQLVNEKKEEGTSVPSSSRF